MCPQSHIYFSISNTTEVEHMFNLLHVHKYLQRGLKWLQGKNNMLPSVQNKKQKRELFLQFVFSYCKVLTKQRRLTGISNKYNSSDKKRFMKSYDISSPSMDLRFATTISKNATYKKPHHRGRCGTIKLHHVYSWKAALINLQLT